MGRVRSATSPQEPQPIRIFLCSCGHPKSEQYCDELEEHLAPLKRQGLVLIQQSHKILAGLVQKNEIISWVYESDIIVLCISSSLFNSDEYWDVMDCAMKLRDEGKVRVVPILVSPADYKATRIRELQVLPRRKKPLSQMSRRSDRDEAYVEIVEDLHRVVQDLQTCMSGEEDVAKVENDEPSDLNSPAFYQARGDRFFQLQQYNKAIAAYDRAISLDKNFSDAYKARAELYRTLASLNYEKLKQLSDQSEEGLE
jgi:tetratricopeptide (TPR) repeat protein